MLSLGIEVPAANKVCAPDPAALGELEPEGLGELEPEGEGEGDSSGSSEESDLELSLDLDACWVGPVCAPETTRTPTNTATSKPPTEPKNTILDLVLLRATESGQSFLLRSNFSIFLSKIPPNPNTPHKTSDEKLPYLNALLYAATQVESVYCPENCVF
jgi:hypothetical protein